MVLRWSTAGILSMLFNPIFFLLTIRLMGWTPEDPLDVIFRLTIAQIISFAFSVILVLVLNTKARSPTR